MLFLLCAVALCYSAAALLPDEPATSTHVESALPPLPDVRRATNDQLIDRLPTYRGHVRRAWTTPGGWPLHTPVADELARRIRNGELLTDEQWRRALLGSEAIRYRKTWPRDRPFAIAINQPVWLDAAEILIEPCYSELSTTYGGTMTLGCLRSVRFGNYLQIENRQPWDRSQVFHVRVVTRLPGERWKSVKRWSGQLRLDIELVDKPCELLTPVDDDRTRDALLRSLRVTCCGHQEDPADHSAVLIIDPSPADRAIFEDLALSLDVELLRSGEVISTQTLSARTLRTDKPSAWMDIAIGSAYFKELTPLLHSHPSKESASLSLRLTGNDRDVLRSWTAERYWTGQVSIPFLEARQRELDRSDVDAQDLGWVWLLRAK